MRRSLVALRVNQVRSHLGVDADVLVGVLVGEDADTCTGHGLLQRRHAHPLAQDVGWCVLVFRLKHALVTLATRNQL